MAGYIAEVRVQDNQQVKAGDVLATLDDRDDRVALESAEADLQVSQAQLEQQQSAIEQSKATLAANQVTAQYAEQNAERYNRLYKSGTIAADDQQKSSSTHRSSAAVKAIGVLQAAVRQAQASVDQVRLNLSYTCIVAPVDGMVGQCAARVGAYVSAGTRLLAVPPLQQTYITANYLETQLNDVRPGRRVKVTVDALPGKHFTGREDSIAPAIGAAFSAISPDNTTGNHTKVVQRLPVKIVLDKDQPELSQLQVNISAIPEIDVP
ncbi:DSBA oxidoreductase|nr:DSBA oxidoreductase [Candidatus Pantoea persica]